MLNGNGSIMDEETPIIEQKESIKLTKNAKGQYQWEIKLTKEKSDTDMIWLNRIEALNNWMEAKYGDKQASENVQTHKD